MFPGGHVKPDVYGLCSLMVEKHGLEAAAEMAEFEVANLDAVIEYVKSTGADCELVLTQAVDVQFSEQHNAALKDRYDGFVGATTVSSRECKIIVPLRRYVFSLNKVTSIVLQYNIRQFIHILAANRTRTAQNFGRSDIRQARLEILQFNHRS